MNRLLTLLVAAAACSSWAPMADADVLVGDFEGDLSAGVFGEWSTDNTLVDDDPTRINGLVDQLFLTDDPMSTASEGVTSGSQSLVLDHYQWTGPFQPYLSIGVGGQDLRPAVLESTSFDVDLTPIVGEAGWGEASFRQAFLALAFDGVFVRFQEDYDGDNVNGNGEPLPGTLSFDLDTFVRNDLNPADGRNFREWSQEAIDQDIEIDLFLILQGRDIDENGDEIPFNGFTPTSVATALDNAQFIGLTVSTPLIGDYNNDGLVDAADYTVWRDNLGEADLPNRDPTQVGVVGEGDYDAWVGAFGNSAAPSLSGAVAVPEPATIGLMLVSVLGLSVKRGRCP